jgi:NAD(P)-dependent dehydrogenase (short-subunit alcohol dehydrogenase family)
MALITVGAIAGLTGAGYFAHSRREHNLYQKTHTEENMRGKIVIVTGANSGMGHETSVELLRRGATVIVACRSQFKAEACAKELNDDLSSSGEAVPMVLELGSLKSVREFVNAFKQKFQRLDVLLLNAGIMNTPYAKSEVCAAVHAYSCRSGGARL